MSYQEKKSIVNMFSALMIAIIYGSIIYQRHMDGRFDLTDDFQKWGVLFLYYIVISIVSRIIIYIIFHIINAIATREQEIPIEDERDKMVKLKSTRNSYFVFTIGFVLAITALAFSLPVYSIFLIFFISGLLSEVFENSSQIYYYRKGI